jgi:integrase
MAQTVNKLSAIAVRRKKADGLFNDGAGLYLQVSNHGAGKSWIFRFSLRGRSREMGLGSCAKVSLAEARAMVSEYHKLIAGGHDPIEHRERQRAQAAAASNTMTFRQCAEAYAASHGPSWGNLKYAKQWRQSLIDYAVPVMGTMPVSAIETANVLEILQPIWTTIPSTASRVRGRIEVVLDWARVKGCRTGDNPARWRGHLDHLLPKTSKLKAAAHHAALSYAELPAFLEKLRQQPGTPAKALEFLILTAARTGEVVKARTGEINLADKVWTVPAARMKGGREHRVPLCDRAVELIDGAGNLLFPGQHPDAPIGKMQMPNLLERMGYSDATVHGFRSSFRDWAAERTNTPNHVVEMALAHAIGDKVEAAYRRGDLFEKRRKLMEAWARYCESVPAESGRVVPLRSA